MSKHLDDVQGGKEIVITRHGKPEGALLSAERLYQYREFERMIAELTALLNATATAEQPDNAQKAIVTLTSEAGQLLKKARASKT